MVGLVGGRRRGWCAAPRVVTFKHGATRFHKAVYWPNYKLDILLNFTREL